MTAVVPANIALIAGAKNADEARKFMAYTMSVPGQQLLFDAEDRAPADPALFDAQAPRPAARDPQDIAARAPRCSSTRNCRAARYPVVISLFDQM